MQDAAITYFPVGNGDTSLITIPDSQSDERALNMLIDCNIRSTGKDGAGNEIFDAQAYLQGILPADDAERLHLDVFILTHADQDHCLGFKRVFYAGEPTKYSDDDKADGKILVDELWFAPRIFASHEGDLCDDAAAFKAEAQRRIDLYRTGSSTRTDAGNRLRVIGYTENDDLAGLDDVLTIPGQTVNVIDNKEQPHFRFLVLAPVKDDSDDEFAERNHTSIVLQARFDIDDEENAVKALFGGDSGCAGWERIRELNSDDELSWDLLLAPHHCSWHFFSEVSHDVSEEPADASVSVLEAHRDGAWVIASCKPILDNDDDPPSYVAGSLYIASVGEEKFLCTGETPSETTPLPILFLMTSNGPVLGDAPENKSRATAAFRATVASPKTYG